MSVDIDKKRTLAAILIGEAGTDVHVKDYDPIIGMHAVFNSMINQAKVSKAKNKSKYMEETPSFKGVYEKAIKPNNYSTFNKVDRKNENLVNIWTNKKLSNTTLETEALNLIDKFLEGNLPDIIDGTTHYYNPNFMGTSAMPILKETHLFKNPKSNTNITSHIFGFDPMGVIEGKFENGKPVFTKDEAYANVKKAFPSKFIDFKFKGEILNIYPEAYITHFPER